ncbi:MAG: rRNA maturation RNase YbeY [Methylocystaceae bacterium]|jgi:probable rRNA maturation factor|nr:rRNA maturation RNase YbeY [Methylocystaceae bacterium]NBT96294.1 rRNA maturation RNase YbeY [Methylocystaceae bacterium]
MSLEIDIVVAALEWNSVEDLDGLTNRCVAASLENCLLTLAPECEISVTYCDDAAITQLNAQWRGKNAPTNVLSFPTPGLLEEKQLLGDIIIAYQTVTREAKEFGRPLSNYIGHMLIHGVLHLVGYDHETDAEAETMENLERIIALKMGLGDPYESEDEMYPSSIKIRAKLN